MSVTKRMFDEIEEVHEMLYDIRRLVLNSNINNSEKNDIVQIIHNLSNKLEDHSIRRRILESVKPLYEHLQTEDGDIDIKISNILPVLHYLNNRINPSDIYIKNSINSEEYYAKKIDELQKREEDLKKNLALNQNQTEEQKKLTLETKEKLKLIENELNKKKKELELKEKQEDAKNDWKQKINETFKNLKEYLKPIENEHKRLNILYYVYAVLGIITLITIVICEIILILKISEIEGLPTLSEYITVLLPLPIAGALMWGFIFQMNRAQRQLIAISNNIHSIKYIQGLLLSINNLSLDINDGISRVNDALDKIISNHLNRKIVTNEKEFKLEEEKDKLEIDKVLKILSVIKK